MSVFYKVVGEGFPVVMLHGWSLDHQVMEHAFEPLFTERKGWKRIYIDLPGMGRSDADPSIRDSDGMLDAVLRLLDELLPGEPFVLCGYSYGGYIARGIISRRLELVRGLLLLAPMTIPAFEQRTVPAFTVLKKDADLLSSLNPEEAEAFSSTAVVQGRTEWERFQKEIFHPSKQSKSEFLSYINLNGYGFSFGISCKLEHPVLIITGRQDHVVGYEDSWCLLEEYPRATFAVLDMAGHNLQIEQADAFQALAGSWLNLIEEERESESVNTTHGRFF